MTPYEALQNHLDGMKLGEAHKERILRLNKGIENGGTIRGLRVNGRKEAVRLFRGWVPKGQVFRTLGPAIARDFWDQLKVLDANARDPATPAHLRTGGGFLHKIGKREYVLEWVLRNAVRQLNEGEFNA